MNLYTEPIAKILQSTTTIVETITTLETELNQLEKIVRRLIENPWNTSGWAGDWYMCNYCDGIGDKPEQIKHGWDCVIVEARKVLQPESEGEKK